MTPADGTRQETAEVPDAETHFALGPGEFVPFHRLAVDERWTVASGDALQLHLIHSDGEYEVCLLEPGATAVVRGGTLRAARLAPGGRLAVCAREANLSRAGLVEVPSGSEILRRHPLHARIVRDLTR